MPRGKAELEGKVAKGAEKNGVIGRGEGEAEMSWVAG